MRLAPAFVLFAALLFADGGSVLVCQQSNGFLITVFGNPQVGPTDLSVLVQNAIDRTPVLDAAVALRIGNSTVRASHEQATNKLLYAASINLPRSGRWPLQVTATSKGNTAEIQGSINVPPEAPPLIAYWPYFAVIPVAIFLFVLNQWLKSKRRIRRLEARP